MFLNIFVFYNTEPVYIHFFLSGIGARRDPVPTDWYIILPDLEFWMEHYPAILFILLV